jgi:large subunit ribosomal protein L19
MNRAKLIAIAEQKDLKAEKPQFEIGDNVTVHVRIKEGNKERLQPFSGTVIARQGRGVAETFTVRRIVENEGVERVFPVFLRKRVGKATRLRERHAKKVAERPAAGDEQTEQ